MRVDTSEIVTISTFIYYYTCFLAIEVTGLLSYAVYKFSIDKEDRDIFERNKHRRMSHVKVFIQINDELKENYNIYIKERGSTNWSFYSEFEVNHFRKQFGYNATGQEFKIIKWSELKGDLIMILNDLKNTTLLGNYEYIYQRLNEIMKYIDKNQLDINLFKNMKTTFEEVLKENEKIINYLSV
ncbi:hypothetical protein [Cohnella lubricantis]|uniref:Uncharacterized protein n=1 Tax=Cohnella lubricantis TaxID=2163172 RepID=A0A841TF10_9BACL|nr:hypothetical protein [Cohnella lubricantis]MBB6677810.1 hypothetical protein [Cohnella lubricantis]MBP2120473.1 hypothetical protein [Cohnella lubricantis]